MKPFDISLHFLPAKNWLYALESWCLFQHYEWYLPFSGCYDCRSSSSSSDTFTVCMERITAVVDGPLGFVAAYAFLQHTSYRYVAQLLLSLCQLYGDTLYFLTEIFEGFSHGELYHPIYFWFYFFFLNSLWIVIPLSLIVDSCIQLARCQAKCDVDRKVKAGKKMRWLFFLLKTSDQSLARKLRPTSRSDCNIIEATAVIIFISLSCCMCRWESVVILFEQFYFAFCFCVGKVLITVVFSRINLWTWADKIWSFCTSSLWL